MERMERAVDTLSVANWASEQLERARALEAMMLRRRLLGVLLAGITLLLMATGCTSSHDPGLSLDAGILADASAPLVREFNASHPGIRLEVTRGPLDTESVSIWRSAVCCWAAAPTTCC